MAIVTSEQFVEKWLEHWGVEWAEERAKQLLHDLRQMTGDAIEIKPVGEGG